MTTTSTFKPLLFSCALLASSIDAQAALVSHTLDFDNILPPRPAAVPNFSAVQMSGSGYGSFNWGDAWYATSEGVQDTYLSTTFGGLSIRRSAASEGFVFEGFEYWSRGGDGDGRKFFYVLYGANGETVYNSDIAKEDLQLRTVHHTLSSAYSDLVYGLAIGFINGGDNDGWRYMGVDDVKFSVDSSATVNTEIPGLNTPVPVPAAMPLFLTGLMAIGLTKKARLSAVW